MQFFAMVWQVATRIKCLCTSILSFIHLIRKILEFCNASVTFCLILFSSIDMLQKESDAVKEVLDQLSEVGWAKRWSSQPYVSRRTVSLNWEWEVMGKFYSSINIFYKSVHTCTLKTYILCCFLKIFFCFHLQKNDNCSEISVADISSRVDNPWD